ncbi:MAG: type IV pilus assembly protein PilM [Thermodesulfobacteriota bacterium]|nr:type IV pilus assembly protein PilM [Thermodesulfobacteriota bacterium]
MFFIIPHKVIGLDIGNDSIKAVQVTGGLKGYRVTGFVKRKRQDSQTETPLYDLAEDIKRMFNEASLEGDVFVSSISSGSVAVRNINLPFSNPNKVRQVINSEMESILPFYLDDILIDYSVTNKRSVNGTDLLVMAAPKMVIKEHLEVMENVSIEPQIVDLDSSSLFYCFDAMGIRKDAAVAIIDIGAKKTTLCIIKDGILKFIRSIPIGGEDITETISKELSIDLDIAEEKKKIQGAILLEHIEHEGKSKSSDTYENKISQAIIDTLDRLSRDIDLAFSYYKTIYFEHDISEILLTGGSSNIKNLELYFEQKFNVETLQFRPLQSLPNSLSDIGSQDQSIMSGALGLAFKGLKRRGAGINFRKEEYSFKEEYTDIKKNLIFIFAGAFLIFSLYMGNLFTNLYLKERQYKGLKEEIRQVFIKTFPDVTNIVNEIQQMENNIRKEKDKNISLGGIQGTTSFLSILRELTMRIPSEKDIKIKKVKMDAEGISILGEAGSFDTVDKINAALNQSRLLKEVQIKDAKMSAQKGVVSFDFRIGIAK